jgi:hypothetical protein
VRDNLNGEDADIDGRLSEWGRAARAAARPATMPAALTAPPARAAVGKTLVGAAGAIALAALVAATVIGLPRYLRLDQTAAPSIAGVTSTATAGPGFQVVTFHGLSITVPDSWQMNVHEPCSITREVVLLPGYRTLCKGPDIPSIAFVEFIEGSDPLGLSGPLETTETTVSGVAATRTDGFWQARKAFAYTVPTLEASVRIVPAQGQTGADLAGSLQVNAVDSHGCRAAVSDVAELPRNKPPARDGAADMLVPGRPDSLRVCRYFAGRLEQGAALTGAQATGLATVLAQLPAGLSRADPDTYLPSLCHTPATGLNTLDGKYRGDLETYRIEADYPSGDPVIVVVRLGLCGDLGAANGSRTGQRTDALVKALTQVAGVNSALISPVIAAP